jgi:Ca2+-binding RTX toxin-like protein
MLTRDRPDNQGVVTMVLQRRRVALVASIVFLLMLCDPVADQLAFGQGQVPTCLGKRATIVGTNGSDRLRGTSARDVIVGAGGGDEIRAGGGRDVVCGEDGRDTIYGGRGADRLSGGLGNDRLLGQRGRDHLSGSPHRDKVLGGRGGDVILGDSDSETGGGDRDLLHGGHTTPSMAT